MKTTTTFGELREAGACRERYRFLAKALGGVKEYGERAPISVATILEKSGLDDAGWAMSDVPSLKPLYDAYWAQLEPLYDAYRAQLKPLDDAYRAQLKPLYDAYWAQLEALDDAYLAQLNALIVRLCEENER